MKMNRIALLLAAAAFAVSPALAQFQVGGSTGGAAGVSSFNSRTGAVTPQTGDYTAAQVGAAPATTGSSILKGNGSGGTANAAAGTDYVGPTTGSAIQKANGAGGLSAAAAGTDYVGPTTGAALQKANGAGGLTAATAGTDYVGATTGSAIQKANGAGGLTPATAGTDFLVPGTNAANPSATGADTAVNGSATTYMRSDASPAIQKADATHFGLVKPDGTTITCTAGVCTASSGSGTVTSVATGNGLCGGPITTTGTITPCVLPNAQVGTTYTTLAGDGGKIVTLTNAASIAVALPQAGTTGFTVGFGVDYYSTGAGVVTVTAAGGSLFDNGLATITVSKGQDAFVFPDAGGNYHVIMSQPVIANNTVMGNVSGAANYPNSITATQLTALINLATTTLPGAVPATGTPSGKYLKDDLTWSAVVSGSDSNWVAGNWYNAYNSGGVGNGVNISATVIEWVPVFFDKPVTIGNLGGRITTTATGNMQFAFYAASGTTGLPTGSSLCATASISTAVSGSWDSACAGTPALSAAGRYWIGYMVDNATAAIASSTNAIALNRQVGADSHVHLSGSGSNFGTEYKTTGVTFGTWPTNPTISEVGATASSIPVPQFSLTSVP